MTTILHITRMNFLSNKAHVYTTTKTCEALAMQQDVQVILLSSDDSLRTNRTKEEFFQKHDVIKRFEIVSLPSFSNLLKGSRIRLVNWLETVAVNCSIAWYVLAHRKTFDVLYYRDCSLILPILLAKYLWKKPIFLELHAVLHKKHGQFLNNFFSNISDGLIAISYGLKDYYEKINTNIIVAFCAASEPERFEKISETKSELREIFGFPQNAYILMYSGNLYKTGNYDSYGIEDIISAMPYMAQDVLFVGVGKKGNEIKDHLELSKRLSVSEKVLFLPWVGKQEVYRYWKSADVLLLPAAGAQIGNSPTKMFEYLCSEKPIVSARTAPIEEVLKDGKNALLVNDYKNPHEWAEKISLLRNNQEVMNTIVSGARGVSKAYTWYMRGKHIADFVVGKSL